MPSIFRNTRLTVAAVWEAIGLGAVVIIFERYFEASVIHWTVQVFRDFGSVNVFSALSGNQSSIVQSLPMVLAWAMISLICYFLYIFFDYVWSLIKEVVPLEVSKAIHKTDIFDNLALTAVTIRIAILFAVGSLIPLALFVIRPIGYFAAALIAAMVADPIYREFWVLLCTFPIWVFFFLALYYVVALITYEKDEISLDEEHNPLLGDDEEAEE